MEELLLRVMEFSIELGVVTSAVVLVTVCLSIALLYASGGYKNKAAVVIVPVVLSVIVGAAGPEDHTSLREWTYFTLPNLILSPIFVSILCYYKRLRKKEAKT